MCGIAGKVSLGRNSVTATEIKQMTDKIYYRGPDDQGVYISIDGRVGLGNRRLSIIDLSSKGHQPMSYLNRYHITYNGEIYNYREERQKLIKKGFKFTSNTDTEVIAALYAKYKERCLDHLRGMFAFAIYDNLEKKVFLARDRLGVKPLKYFYNQNIFIFSSELKALLTQKEVKARIDFEAIHNYLTFGFVPSPKTGFINIHKLEPGHYILLDLNKNHLSNHKYWQPDFSEKFDLDEPEWCKKILDSLEESTKLRMISDVPIGAFLSGGVDSSGVVATMARISDKRIKTFTIGFEDQKNDERQFAQKIAKLYNTDHETLVVKPESIEELIPKLVNYYEEPFADSSSVITYKVCKMAKKYVTVVLTGDGGDENFAGYDNRVLRLQRDILFDKYRWLIKPFIPFSTYISKRNNNPFLLRVNKFLEKSRMDLASRYITYNCYFTNSEKELLYTKGFNKSIKGFDSYYIGQKLFASSKTTEKHNQALFFDLVNWLPDSQLTKVDIASMAVSLETRSPFLDYKMAELACKIPFNLKVKNGETKYILKKALEKIVPKENLYRPKMGFTVPLDKWFKGNLKSYTKNILFTKNSFTMKVFNKNFIQNMLESHSETNDFGQRLWALLSLESWYKNYFD